MAAGNNLIIIAVIGAAALLMSGNRTKPAGAKIAGISGGGGGLFDTVTKQITAPNIVNLPEKLKISPKIIPHPFGPGAGTAGVVVTDTIGMLDDADADPGYTLGGGGDVVVEDIATPTTKRTFPIGYQGLPGGRDQDRFTKPKPNQVYIKSPAVTGDTTKKHISRPRPNVAYSKPVKRGVFTKQIGDVGFEFD